MGFNPAGKEPAYSVQAVKTELIQGSMPYVRFQMSEEKGALSVKQPSRLARETVEEWAARAGEKGELSEADREVVALALDLKLSGLDPVVVSDDYAVQNLAEHLQLGHSALASFGIIHKFQWVRYCPACHRRYNQPVEKCTVCGTTLKRRVLSKARVRRTATRQM